jgi:protein TonB
MRSPLLFVALAGVAWGQINPQIDSDAEKLYRRAATALQQLPAYEMDVETTLQKPHGESGLGFHILATVAVRQPDQILISGSTPFAGQTTVYSDGRTSLFWQEATNQYAKIDAAIPAKLLLRLTDLTPESEPVEQTLISAKFVRNEEIYLEGEKFDCKVIEVATTGREGVKADPRVRTIWIDTKTGVALRQQTDVVPPGLAIEVPASIVVTRFRYGNQINNGGFAFIVPADATEVDWHQMDLAVTHRGLIGKLPPTLHLTTVDGRAFDLGRLRGKPVLLHFQTTWCKPCEESSAVLDNVAKTVGNEVRILRVNVDESASAVLAGPPQRFPLMATSADVESLGLKAWPANMLIGRDGKILSFDAGRESEAALVALLQSAASDAPAPPPQTWGAMEPRRGSKNQGDVTPPELVYKVDPGYTLEAQKAKISGTVMLSILVGTDGKVREIHVLDKLEPGLDARAITAVSKWRFNPATHNNIPVAFRARAGVTFSEEQR